MKEMGFKSSGSVRSALSKTGKTRRGRPTTLPPHKAFNFHCDADLHRWLNDHRGQLSMTQFLNKIIRERAKI